MSLAFYIAGRTNANRSSHVLHVGILISCVHRISELIVMLDLAAVDVVIISGLVILSGEVH